MLAEFGRLCADFEQTLADSGSIWVEFGPKLAQVGSKLGQLRPSRQSMGRPAIGA